MKIAKKMGVLFVLLSAVPLYGDNGGDAWHPFSNHLKNAQNFFHPDLTPEQENRALAVIAAIGVTGITTMILIQRAEERGMNRYVRCRQIAYLLGGGKNPTLQHLPAPPPDRDYLISILRQYNRPNAAGTQPLLFSIGEDRFTPAQMAVELQNKTSQGEAFLQAFLRQWNKAKQN